MFIKKILTVATFVLCSASLQARTIIDHMDRTVEVPDTIQRIAVTNIFPFPSVLSVFLGGTDKIVGIHKVSKVAAEKGLLAQIYPAIKNVNTSFMKGNTVNIESLLALNPDVVFVNAGDTVAIKAIENAGIPTIAVSVNKWNYNVLTTYEAWLKLLSDVFPERSKADKASTISQEVAQFINSRIATIPDNERQRILFLFQYEPKRIVTSGKKFFGQYWADAIGAKNVAETIQAENSNAQVNMEQIYSWNPDIVFITNFTPTLPQDLFTHKYNDWSSIKAVKEQRVYKMPLGIYRSYTPSADTPMTLLWFAKTIYPEYFKDVDLTREVKNYYKKLFNVDLTDQQVSSIYEARSDRAEGFTGSVSARK